MSFSIFLERWVAVKGYEKLYEVSSCGRVRSLARIYVRGAKRGEMVLSCALSTKGRPVVSLYRGAGRGSQVAVHHLVLEAFVGERPAGMQGCHNNGVRTDNRATNLRWDTPKSNQHDRKLHGTALVGFRHPMAKLTESDAVEIVRLAASGVRHPAIAARYGVYRKTIGNLLRRYSSSSSLPANIESWSSSNPADPAAYFGLTGSGKRATSPRAITE
jgi:NUMOD4 motif-containing protein/HNH endonuclease/Homeodomain-like domain-containing protein